MAGTGISGPVATSSASGDARVASADWPRWLSGLVAAVLVTAMVCVSCTGVVVARVVEADRPEVAYVDPFVLPGRDAEFFDVAVWSEQALRARLQQRSAAMMTGDEQAFVDVIDPALPELREQQRRMFSAFQRMGVGFWQESGSGLPKYRGLAVSPLLEQSFCFGGPNCRPETVTVATTWRFVEGEGYYLTQMDTGVRPWELSDLDVATGQRTIVLVASGLGVPASRFLSAAEEAARIAGPFARWGDPPDRYVVAVAGDEEFTTWYGNIGSSPAGIHFPEYGGDVMVRYSAFADEGPAAELDLMTHELAHAATLAGPRHGLRIGSGNNPTDRDWMVEGIAEYVTMVGRPISEYDRLEWVRRAVHQPQTLTTGDQKTVANYGIWFLQLRWLADTYGEEAMLDFFGTAIHEGLTIEDAAKRTFGQTWTELKPSIDAFIRTV